MREPDGRWLRFDDSDPLGSYFDVVVADSSGDVWYLSTESVRIRGAAVTGL
jgi:hypothetical protein